MAEHPAANRRVAVSSPAGGSNSPRSIPSGSVTFYSERTGNSFDPNGVLDRCQPARLIVEIAQIVLHEGDKPDALADLRHADVLAGEAGVVRKKPGRADFQKES